MDDKNRLSEIMGHDNLTKPLTPFLKGIAANNGVVAAVPAPAGDDASAGRIMYASLVFYEKQLLTRADLATGVLTSVPLKWTVNYCHYEA